MCHETLARSARVEVPHLSLVARQRLRLTLPVIANGCT
jgi:hypothetical protein